LTVNVEVEQISVRSIVDFAAALTDDTFHADTKVLSLALTTVIVWPNMLDGPITVTTPNSDIIFNGVTGWTGCDSNVGSLCEQKYGFDVAANGDICTFDGEYNVTYKLRTCRTASEGCTESTATVTFTISTSNICGQVTSEASISGSLISYTDASATTTANEFKLGDTGYFFAQIGKNGNTVSSITFQSISIDYKNGITKPLYNEGIRTAEGNATKIVAHHTDKYFELYFHSLAFPLQPSTNSSYTIKATCSIVFTGNEKRTVELTFAADSVNTSAKIKLVGASSESPSAQTDAPQSSNQAALIGGIVGGVAGVALLTVGIALLVKRNRTKAAAAAAGGLVNNSA
jgi:hypothetical protein